MIVALILLEGLSWGLVLIGLLLLLAARLDPSRPSRLGEKWLLWGVGLVLVGAVGGVVVLATLA